MPDMTDLAPAPDVTNDMTDEDALGILFSAPTEIVNDPRWVAAYEAQVRQLRRDAMGLPLDAAQLQLIERIASSYIRLKWYETNGGLSENQRDMLFKQYLSVVTQFQKILLASDEALRQDLIKKFSNIVVQIADMIPDPETRKLVRSFIQEQFRALGF